MPEVRAIRYRVLPCTPAKARAMHRLAGACRFAWNGALRANRDAWAMRMEFGGDIPSPTFLTLGKSFTRLREQTPWLREHSFKVVRHALKRQADAWQRYFKGQGARPRFKSRHGDQGFTIPDQVRIDAGLITIPKIGRLRRRGGNPYPDGVPKQAVFKRVGRKWFCTVFCAVGAECRVDDGKVLGLDRNVGQCADSGGRFYRLLPNERLKRLETKRKRHQRRMARQVKGSHRRARTKARAAKQSRSIANIRGNFAHQSSRALAIRRTPS